MKDFNPQLYLVADPNVVGRSAFLRIVEKAIAGGITTLQLRDKQGSTLELLSFGAKLRELTKKARIPLIINDRVDIALAVDAEGVHLGQEDIQVSIARHLLGKKKIIGISVKTVEDAKRAEKDGADYLGVGPVFQTKSKKDAGTPIGFVGLKEIVATVSIPVVAIGGINKDNTAKVVKAGVAGIAVISAVLKAENPQRATRELLSVFTMYG